MQPRYFLASAFLVRAFHRSKHIDIRTDQSGIGLPLKWKRNNRCLECRRRRLKWSVHDLPSDKARCGRNQKENRDFLPVYPFDLTHLLASMPAFFHKFPCCCRFDSTGLFDHSKCNGITQDNLERRSIRHNHYQSPNLNLGSGRNFARQDAAV